MSSESLNIFTFNSLDEETRQFIENWNLDDDTINCLNELAANTSIIPEQTAINPVNTTAVTTNSVEFIAEYSTFNFPELNEPKTPNFEELMAEDSPIKKTFKPIILIDGEIPCAQATEEHILPEFIDEINLSQSAGVKNNKIIKNNIVKSNIIESNIGESNNNIIDNGDDEDIEFNLSFNPADYFESSPIGQRGGQNNLYEITNDRQRRCKKFNCTERVIDFVLKDQHIENFVQANRIWLEFFQKIYDDYITTINPHSKVRIMIDHDSFICPINMPFMYPTDITVQMLIDQFESTIQSRKMDPASEVQPNQRMRMSLMIAEIVRGSGKRRKQNSNDNERPFKKLCHGDIINFKEFCEVKNSILQIINRDHFCLLRAVIVAIAYENKEKNARCFLRKNNIELTKRVNELATKLNISNKHCGIEEIKKIEEYFEEFQICVVSPNYKLDNEMLYINTSRKFDKFIYLLYSNNHFDVIRSMKAFLDRSYFCNYCKIAYMNAFRHKCQNVCESCCRVKCEKEIAITCKHCKKICNSHICEKMHVGHVCRALKTCSECGYYKANAINHVCGEMNIWCKNCAQSVTYDHRCYMMTESEHDAIKPPKNNKKFAGYIFFDFETYELPETRQHHVNLAMAQKICVKCLEIENCENRCDKCKEKHIFYSIEEYCEWALVQHNTIHMAHNLKGYDGVFILNYILKNLLPTDAVPHVIANGTKLMAITFRKIKIIDSYSFIQMPLSEFSNTFSLNELKKGFFPHRFNKVENQNYIGPYPDKSYYQPEFFKLNKKKEFDEWYEKVKNDTFDFKREFQDYCWSDVQLLTEGCLKFRRINMQDTRRDSEDCGVDPFRVAMTIASFCNYVYRRNFMVPKTIAIIPENGYNPEQKTSFKCQLWLKYISEKEKILIQHAKNGGERKCGKYLLDGVCEETKTIYEFHGCLFHGCMQCYTETTFNSLKQMYQHTVNMRHYDRINFIKKEMPTYNLIEIWEHTWDDMVKNDLDVIEFVRKQEGISEPIKIRDALFGGRTNALCLYYKCKEGERIDYIDYTSLYPFVQKYGIYPIGHPEIITENFDISKKYFGLIKCKILPPRKLHIPVLPARINNKLIFALCGLCAANYAKDSCTHTEEERCLTGTWVSLEVDKAIEKGYKIIKYYEVWHWTQSEQYNRETKTGGIFTEYINKCLKEKQEASGFPDNCNTLMEKMKYILDYYENEGIKLEFNEINKNKGRRATAKMKANSQWGYLAMNCNKLQYKIVTNAHVWNEMLASRVYSISNCSFFEEEDRALQVFYKYANDFYYGGLKTNVVVASFVTCQARLHLYKELEKLNERVLYFDTDSIIYLTKATDTYRPKLGNYLGDFTSEVDPSEGTHIEEFVSAGPKNYGYKTNLGVSHCTIKGINLNYIASLKVNFETIRNIVCNDQTELVHVDQQKFVRDKETWTLKTNVLSKKYGFVYDKRVLNEDLTTRPYGF